MWHDDDIYLDNICAVMQSAKFGIYEWKTNTHDSFLIVFLVGNANSSLHILFGPAKTMKKQDNVM